MLQLLVFVILAGGFVILQSTVLDFMAFQGNIPDFAFIVLVYYAYHYGSFTGMIAGFFVGLTMDFATLSPLGFFTLVGTLCGFIVGKGKETVQLDIVFLPMALVALAMIVKGIITLVLALVLGQASVVNVIFSLNYLISILYTSLVSWIIFILLRLLNGLVHRKTNYQ